MARIISLTTDFGLSDSYVAQMKGVILNICPDVKLIDLTHSIPHCDIRAGARFLKEATPLFPDDTIHLAIVDPGVGGTRRRLVIEAHIETEIDEQPRRQFYVGPDNGIFSLVASRGIRKRVWEISRLELLPNFKTGETFEGRNVFAPVAALIALGHEPSTFGKTLESSPASAQPIEIENFSAPICMDGILKGQIVHFDHFGNAATNIPQSQLGRGKIIVSLPRKSLTLEVRRSFEEFDTHAPGCIINSQGFLEIVANQASARDVLGLKLGDSMQVTLG